MPPRLVVANTVIPRHFDEIPLHRDISTHPVDAAKESLEQGSISHYLDNLGNGFFADRQTKFYLVTANFDTSTSYTSAWKKIQTYRDDIAREIAATLSPHLVVSTIEHVHQIPEKHKSSRVHTAATTDEFISTIKSHLHTGFIPATIVNINIAEYTIAALNFFSEMIYTATIHKRDKALLDYATSMYNQLQPLVDEGRTYPFPFETASNGDKHYNTFYYTGPAVNNIRPYEANLLAIAHLQMFLKMTTVGYPHLHIAVGMRPQTEVKDVERALNACIIAKSSLLDMKSEGKKKMGRPRKSDAINSDAKVIQAFSYVLKNHAAKVPIDTLTRFEQSNVIVKAMITSTDYPLELYDFLFKLTPSSGAWTSNPQCAYNKAICMAITTTRTSLPIMQSQRDNLLQRATLKDPTPVAPPPRFVDPEQSKLMKYYYTVQKLMDEKGYAFCEDGYVYKKIPESRMSYKAVHTIEDFADSFNTHVEFQTAIKHHRNSLVAMAKSEVNNVDERYQIKFPRIKLNYRMIEYGDFFFNTLTCRIYPHQNKHNCFIYYPQITLANINDYMNSFMKKSQWLDLLRKVQLYNAVVIAKLYNGLRPRDTKDLVPALIGNSDVGKSTIYAPFIKMYPPSKVGVINGKLDEFHIDALAGKKLELIEEANTVANSAGRGTGVRSMFLPLLGGEPITSAKKHGAITHHARIPAAIFMAANIDPGDEWFTVAAIVNRCHLIYVAPKEKFEVEATKRRIVEYEAPIVTLFAAMCRLMVDHKLDYLPQIPTIQFDENQDRLIEDIENYVEDVGVLFPFTPPRNANPDALEEGKRVQEVKDAIANTIFYKFPHACELPTMEMPSQKDVINSIVAARNALRNNTGFIPPTNPLHLGTN